MNKTERDMLRIVLRLIRRGRFAKANERLADVLGEPHQPIRPAPPEPPPLPATPRPKPYDGPPRIVREKRERWGVRLGIAAPGIRKPVRRFRLCFSRRLDRFDVGTDSLDFRARFPGEFVELENYARERAEEIA